MARRRREDMDAVADLGAQIVHLGFIDAMYRCDPTGRWIYPTFSRIVSDVATADPTRAGAIAAAVDAVTRRLAEVRRCTVVSPLAIGNHIDHQLVRAAAEMWCRPHRLRYYEDFPYVDAEHFHRMARPAPEVGQLVIPLSESAMRAKARAIARYQSQLGLLFGSRAAMIDRVCAGAARAAIGTPSSWAERQWVQRDDEDGRL